MFWAIQNGAPIDLGAQMDMDFGPTKIEALKNGIVGSVMVAQPLFVGGQIVIGNKLARVGEEVAELQAKMSKDELILSAEDNYWQLISLQEKLKTVEDAESMLQKILSDVSAKRKKLEIKQAENFRNQTKDLLLQEMEHAQNELTEAYHLVEIAKRAIVSAKLNHKISQDNYNSGVIALTELLEAQNLVQQSNDNYIETLTEFYQSNPNGRRLVVNRIK